MGLPQRPISPHLQIYKPQLTSVLSITHRATGLFLSVGALLLSCWLTVLALGQETYHYFQQHATAWYGKILVIAFIFSLYYHLFNGIRHLCWDAGLGLDLATTYKSGYAVIAASISLTAMTIYIELVS